MEILASLDTTTLFVVRAFVQLVLAITIGMTTLRRNGELAATIWFAASLINAVAWIILPIGLQDATGNIASMQAALVVLAVLLHTQALAVLHDQNLPVNWWPLVPAGVLVVGFAFRFSPYDAGTLMAFSSGIMLLFGCFFAATRLRPLMRGWTYYALALGSILGVASAAARVLSGIVSPTGLSGEQSSDLLSLFAFASSFSGLVVVQMTWLTLLRDRAERKLQRLAFFDALTGIENRHSLEEMWRSHFSSLPHAGGTVTMLDVDHFKSINDRWGHDTGDHSLKVLGNALSAIVSPMGRAFRLGGEEFCIVLPGADTEETSAMIGELRAHLIVSYQLPDGAPLLFSAGITSIAISETELASVLVRADQALYRAKRNGRDRSEIELLTAA